MDRILEDFSQGARGYVRSGRCSAPRSSLEPSSYLPALGPIPSYLGRCHWTAERVRSCRITKQETPLPAQLHSSQNHRRKPGSLLSWRSEHCCSWLCPQPCPERPGDTQGLQEAATQSVVSTWHQTRQITDNELLCV